MKSIISSLFSIGLLSNVASAAIVVTFDELRGDTSTSNGSYFNGYSGAPSGSWQTAQGVSFNTGEWGGWSYSNIKDTKTAGFSNQFASATGTDSSGEGYYALANTDGAYFNLPANSRIESLLISNTTYAHLSMQNGDAFAKKFGGVSGDAPDFFKITLTGYSGLGGAGASTGLAEFYLADFRYEDNDLDYIVNDWRLVDLTGLGDARSVSLSFAGSDNAADGYLNTPTYAAVDDITLSTVPEPSGLLLLTCLAATLTLRRRRV